MCKTAPPLFALYNTRKETYLTDAELLTGVGSRSTRMNRHATAVGVPKGPVLIPMRELRKDTAEEKTVKWAEGSGVLDLCTNIQNRDNRNITLDVYSQKTPSPHLRGDAETMRRSLALVPSHNRPPITILYHLRERDLNRSLLNVGNKMTRLKYSALLCHNACTVSSAYSEHAADS
jgi:hypothetical protein